MILGDGDGNVLKLTAWRDAAELWGIGTDTQPPIRRGDIVLFQGLSSGTWNLANSSHTDLSFGWDPSSGAPPTFTVSPYMEPTTEICYRTMDGLRLRQTEDYGLTSGSAESMHPFLK